MSGVTWRKWRPEQVREMTIKELQTNGEIVGEFLEQEARKRLDAIKKPDNARAVAWRRFLSKWVLTHTVDTEGKTVIIRVGMKKGPGKKGAMRGFYIEIGSRKAPATSFLRRTILENKATILKTLVGK